MSQRLAGKVAIVTGGASGIGLAIADQFAKEGAKVVATDINEDSAKNLTAQNQSDNIKFFKQDVTDSSQWPEVFKFAKDSFGTVNILVNNAGIGMIKSFEEITDAEWDQIQAVNLNGPFYGTREGIRQMKNQPHGASIINMSSIEGLIGDPGTGAYNASKGGIRLMTKSAALDCALKDYDVRINTVHPGYIKTPLVETQPGIVEAMSERTKTPMGHIGEPEDIAYLCVYLASDEAKFATGAEFTVDGGYTAQ
ncbi:FabG-like short-chain dehydrogenase/reductase [Ligilactobacillus salitolerans]|uniref:FabG-like short-chain dehydrogenase/reductase n=1 Tax=Ligilactobacillus salitolerans TaxID=1808352 RepID=A0A401IRC9_9LACO|nr:glucose 1-dehydrogenase [Ligilactobacillus salitolerans]GBG94092.1 FabG-like short-chain dehydrogenase/reductase [Ligilactobacillus salitolerans]